MDVRDATRTAKEYLVDLFDGEEIMHVGLEEVVFDGNVKLLGNNYRLLAAVGPQRTANCPGRRDR